MPLESSPVQRQSFLVTGAAGFVGFWLCRSLLGAGARVAGVDNFNPYYDPSLKHERSALLEGFPGFEMHRVDVAAGTAFDEIFAGFRPGIVVHLAGQPGIAFSVSEPVACVQSNVVGTLRVLEACRHHGVEHLVYASSSSVYAGTRRLPFSENDDVDHPFNLYAATKRSGELMAHSYSHLFGIPATGLRLFSVYGPWGRPDMAYFSFARSILESRPITIYGDGNQGRDLTYIDDVVRAIVALALSPPGPSPERGGAGADPAAGGAPCRLLNVGHGCRVTVNRMVELLESFLGARAIRRHEPSRAADMPATLAALDHLRESAGEVPRTSIESGMAAFAGWFLDYHRRGHSRPRA